VDLGLSLFRGFTDPCLFSILFLCMSSILTMATSSSSDVLTGFTQTVREIPSSTVPYTLLDGQFGMTVTPEQSTVVPQTAAFILGFIVAFFIFMLLVLSCGGSQHVRRARLRWIRRIMGLPDPPDIPVPPRSFREGEQKLPERPIIWDAWIPEESVSGIEDVIKTRTPNSSDPWQAIKVCSESLCFSFSEFCLTEIGIIFYCNLTDACFGYINRRLR
jgi:hypothetical protein